MAWTVKTSKGLYLGKYRDRDGKVRTADGGPFAHKANALRAGGAAEAESRAVGWRSPDAALQTWGTWCEAWWPTRSVEASTRARDASRRDVHLMPRWDDVPLADITRHDVKAWAAEMRAGGSSPSTVQRAVHLLSASLVAAVDAEVLTANPAARLRLPNPKPAAERYLTRDEFDAALAELDVPEFRRLAQLLGGTGMRLGEATGAHWARVAPKGASLLVVDVWDTTRREVRPYPKDRQPRRVPIPSWVDLGTRSMKPCPYTHVGADCRSGLIVTTARGAVVDESKFRKAWTAACERAGLGHVRVHDIRHSYASWLLQGGVSLAEVGRLLGHESPTTTQRYAHLAEVPNDQVLKALGGRRGGGATVVV